MRLLSIGRSKSSTICIPNEYVSANHAELVLLDNGDILLTDCNSTHGTFVFGKRITPGVEVPVKRGDKIDFDQIPLDWSKVPNVPQPDLRVVKGIYGIGKNQRNRYRLSGDSVSRYHATFKEMKNGTWFIQDHSTNGTFVNGQRIPSNQDYKITYKDQIVCGTVGCPNPVPKPKVNWQILAGIGAAAALVAIIFLLKDSVLPAGGHKMDPQKAVAIVTQKFILKVKFEDYPLIINDIFEEEGDWYIGGKYGMTKDKSEAAYGIQGGTAFFVSDNGLLLTNKHVVNWVWANKKDSNGDEYDELCTRVENFRRFVGLIIDEDALSFSENSALQRWLKSPYSLEVETLELSIKYPGRSYSSKSELDWAKVIAQSESDDVDLAVIRLNSMKTPDFADYFRLDDAVRDFSKLKIGSTNYATVGFPLAVADFSNPNEPSAEVAPKFGLIHLVQAPKKTLLVMQGDQSVGGQSGSPIYDDKNRLIGVLWGGLSYIESTFACPICNADILLKEILDEDAYKSVYKSTVF